MRARLVWLAALAVLIGCGSSDRTVDPAGRDAGAPAPDAGSACDPREASVTLELAPESSVVQLSVPPMAIDSASDLYPVSQHQLFVSNDPGVTRRDELLLFLPGTSNHAQGFERLGALAARAGFPVIVLAYESETNQASLCASVGYDDPAAQDACRTAVILEKIYGTDESDVIEIDEANSIVGRAVRLLRHVEAERPELGASAFLDGDTLRWERIVVAGFSQGAVMAGRISRDHALARAVLLAGGCDAFTDLEGTVHLASWCTEARATPAARTFALMHTMDEPEEDRAVHEAFGLTALGDYAHAPTESPAYCTGTHLLETDLRSQGDETRYHLSVAHDEYVPLDAQGLPVLAEDYLYLFTGGAG